MRAPIFTTLPSVTPQGRAGAKPGAAPCFEAATKPDILPGRVPPRTSPEVNVRSDRFGRARRGRMPRVPASPLASPCRQSARPSGRAGVNRSDRDPQASRLGPPRPRVPRALHFLAGPVWAKPDTAPPDKAPPEKSAPDKVAPDKAPPEKEPTDKPGKSDKPLNPDKSDKPNPSKPSNPIKKPEKKDKPEVPPELLGGSKLPSPAELMKKLARGEGEEGEAQQGRLLRPLGARSRRSRPTSACSATTG